MVTFVAIYRGRTFNSARLVATTTAPDAVRTVAQTLLDAPRITPAQATDPVVSRLNEGEQNALLAVIAEAA